MYVIILLPYFYLFQGGAILCKMFCGKLEIQTILEILNGTRWKKFRDIGKQIASGGACRKPQWLYHQVTK